MNASRATAAALLAAARAGGLHGAAVLRHALDELEDEAAVWGGMDRKVAQLLLERLARVPAVGRVEE